MDSYYDVDAILTDAQKLPCTFQLNVPGLGFLDNNSGGDVKKGAIMSLPLWLGGYLAWQQFGDAPTMNIDLPASLSPRVLNALKANPRTVDLRALAPHFYELAARVLELIEEDEVADVLIETLRLRAAEIADHAHNTQGALGEGVDFLRGLDELERQCTASVRSASNILTEQVFRSSHDSSKALRIWIGELKKR